MMHDASTGGKISLKTHREAIKIIENMIANVIEFKDDKAMVPSKRLLEVNTQDHILAQQ